MKRIHPEDPRVTAFALGELIPSEAREVERAALLDPAVQEAIDETRRFAGLLGESLGKCELALGPDRVAAIRRAGRSSAVTTALPSANPRRRWGRAALITGAAATLMLTTVFVLKEIPVKELEGSLAEGGQGVLEEEVIMRLLLAPAPGPGRVHRLAQGAPIAPPPANALPRSGEGDEEWLAEYRALTRLLHEDPERFFDNVERVARAAGPGDIAKLPTLVDNAFVDSKENERAVVPVVSGTASYAMVERFIRGEGALPPRNAVRVEELINSIAYADSGDSELEGIRLGAELVQCPWDPGKLLLGVLLQNGSEEMIPSTAALRLEIKAELVTSYRLVGYAGMAPAAGDGESLTEAAVDAGLAPGRSNFVIFELQPGERDLNERWVMVRVGLALGQNSPSSMIVPVTSPPREWQGATDNMQTAAILAGYGLLLRDSPYKAALTPDLLTNLAEAALRPQREGDLARREALQLVIDSRALLEQQ